MFVCALDRCGCPYTSRRVRQRSEGGMHSVQIKAAAQDVSPAPCPSHTLQAQIHSNLRDTLEHHVVLGFCPPRPVGTRLHHNYSLL